MASLKCSNYFRHNFKFRIEAWTDGTSFVSHQSKTFKPSASLLIYTSRGMILCILFPMYEGEGEVESACNGYFVIMVNSTF